MVSNIFYFSICWEQLSQLTNIVQRGWNHQPVIVSPQFSYSPSLVRRGCPNVPIAEDSTDGLSPTNQPGYNISRARQGWYPDARSSLLQGVAQHEDPIRSILPSGKHTKSYRKSPFLMGKSTISMAISNSYVKLPEGMRGFGGHRWGAFDVLLLLSFVYFWCNIDILIISLLLCISYTYDMLHMHL